MNKILQDKPNAFVVSLGDLGESLKCDVTLLQMHFAPWSSTRLAMTAMPHKCRDQELLQSYSPCPSIFEDSNQLFAGTSACFKLAREYLDGPNLSLSHSALSSARSSSTVWDPLDLWRWHKMTTLRPARSGLSICCHWREPWPGGRAFHWATRLTIGSNNKHKPIIIDINRIILGFLRFTNHEFRLGGHRWIWNRWGESSGILEDPGEGDLDFGSWAASWRM